jgi:hypothetical protein
VYRLPYSDFGFSPVLENIDYFLADDNICVVDGVLKLRCRGSNGLFAPPPYGSYTASIVELRAWIPSELDSLFGFRAYGAENNGEIGFQFSADDGVSWLYYDGATWIPAGGDWNTVDDADAGIATFPYNGSLKIRIRLAPSSNNLYSPYLTLVRIFCEFRPFAMMDDVYRSFKHFLRDKCTYRQLYQEELNGTNLVIIPDRFQIIGEVKVFDLALDPNKRDNLVDVVTDQEILLTRNVTGTIEAQFLSTPGVHLGTDAGMTLAETPAIIFQLLSNQEDKLSARDVYADWEVSKKVVRVRKTPLRYNVFFQIKSIAHKKARVVGVNDAIRRGIEREGFIRSLALDRYFNLLLPSGAEAQEDEPETNLLVHRYEGNVEWLDWNQSISHEVPLAEEVVIGIWPMGWSDFTQENT